MSWDELASHPKGSSDTPGSLIHVKETGIKSSRVGQSTPVQFTFSSSASIFSVAIEPVNSSVAVSGGEDDKAYIWQIKDGQTLLECHGK